MNGECEAAVTAIYALPALTEASSAYGLGFALVMVPWLLAWGGSRLIKALGLTLN